jgi:hypothetical protein
MHFFGRFGSRGCAGSLGSCCTLNADEDEDTGDQEVSFFPQLFASILFDFFDKYLLQAAICNGAKVLETILIFLPENVRPTKN